MSYVRIWVHIVFSTKYRKPVLPHDIRKKVQLHIMDYCKKNNIFLQSINGYYDHLHCLISLGREQTIAKVCQLIKGESSHWINEKKLTKNRFEWQDDYWAASVSDSDVPRIINYIANQEAHHAKKTLGDELNDLSREK